jgi:hypothetical protein
MATTSNTYTANGTNKLFSITFPYLDTSDINVYLNGVLQTITTQYSFANATTVEFVTAPANGAEVLLDRSTDDTALQATFFPGSSIKADDLNFNFDQVLYLAQETANSAANQSTAGLQAQITAANNTSNTALTTANTANATANAASTTANGIAGTANTALTTAQAAETTANGIAATANTALANSTAAVATANAAARIVRGTAVAATSGTSIDFTGIPSWAKRITVVFDGVSTTPTNLTNIMFQLGDSGGFETTGYLSFSSIVGTDFTVNANSATASFATSGFFFLWGSETSLRYGTITFTNIMGNQWTCSGVMGGQVPGSFAGTAHTGGTKTLSGTLDRVRLTTTTVGDTFDAGMVNIIYEG